ncbi:MAG: HNH endonuclease signature motif containing protein [Dehalococcoidales bacterium]|nr:HNH endonuclease signature motif containing protein [Dehalococcoidales bacterium]
MLENIFNLWLYTVDSLQCKGFGELKKTQRSFNSTLRANKGLKPVSKKQAKRNGELAKIEPPIDGKCQNCHELPDWRGLAKHHKTKRSQGGQDSPDNIIWLCGKCHSLFHGIKEC